MAAANFSRSLEFVWRPGYDTPADGYHVTPGDPGGGTKGGVIEATWTAAKAKGLVTGALCDASNAQLSLVLQTGFWGPACDALPPGLDLALFNGRMMSAGYPKLLQQALGLAGDDVDGVIAAQTLGLAQDAHPPTLIRALFGMHTAYLTKLPGWARFKGGWFRRLVGARDLALAIAAEHPGV